MGLNDLHEEGNFKWIDGSNSTSENTTWKENEPNGGTRENCGETHRDYGSTTLLNDAVCSHTHHGLCQKTLSL